MVTRTVHIDWPLGLPSPQREGWEVWLHRHGLPGAGSIPVPSVIVCDDTARTVTVEVYRTDGQGRLLWGERRGVALVQLEAPALPIPDGYTVDEEVAEHDTTR